MTPRIIDLRSDTVTLPTRAMREAMLTCEVGDDVLREDPTINRLEDVAARLLGKEAALFVPSGTFANQCAIATHVGSGDEVLVSETAHIVQHEAGAAALIARAQLRTVSPSRGSRLAVEDLEPRIRQGDDIHYPRTGLVCVEQATAYGEVYGLDELAAIRAMARAAGIPVHMDGARIFNAAEALGVEAAAVTSSCDSVCFCLSKGLAAPVGSVLLGSRDFVERARRMRKRMGGGLRQAGFLAAAGLVALDTMRGRLAEDHRNARILEGLLAAIPGVSVSRDSHINMVFVRIEGTRLSQGEIHEGLRRRGVLTYEREGGEWRFVTHAGISEEDVRTAAAILKTMVLEGGSR
ncbi:MAG: low specificity L-threonine aldolase [Deltaproteobacteria bacterium]|nr:low specificity L-threonine aldolase [Deltaproteobacteria bacterium]